MQKHDWLVDVCIDLKEYARINGLEDLEDLLRHAVAEAKREAAAYSAETNDDPSARVVPFLPATRATKKQGDAT